MQNMKNASAPLILFSSLLFVPSIAGSREPAADRSGAKVQFYKPNTAARLVVALKNKAKYRELPVTVTVLVSNQGLEPILVNSRMLFNQYPLEGELSFIIKGPDDKALSLTKAIAPHPLGPEDLTVMGVGDTIERVADLTDMYGMQKHGKYRVQVIYYNRADLSKKKLKTWRGAIASEPTEITLQ
jgi:hypothetical protein